MLIAALSFTAFIKISIVFMIVRNAIGLQQVPGNIVIMALAMMLAVFISMPIFANSLEIISGYDHSKLETFEEFADLFFKAVEPFQNFISQNTSEESLAFFLDASQKVWDKSGFSGSKDMIIIQVPSFLLTELTEAFQIGFLVYLPLATVDIVVTTLLIALGMQQVQPSIISAPIKLLLFVAVDGWNKLSEGLILGY